MFLSRFMEFFRRTMIVLTIAITILVVILPAASAAEQTVIPTHETSIDWKAIAGGGLLTLLQVLGTGIATLLGAALLWVSRAAAKRFNIQMSAEQDAQVYAAADRAVAWAEEWARKEFVKPTGSEKADAALLAMREVLDSQTYKDYGEPALRKLLDAALVKLRAQESATAATPTPAD